MEGINKSNQDSSDVVVATDVADNRLSSSAAVVVVDDSQDQKASSEESEPNNNNNNNNNSSPSSNSSTDDDASDIAIANDDDDEDDELQATPGHLHALANRTSPARLLPKVHSDGKLMEKLLSPAALQRRRNSASRSVNSSRSSSPHSHSIPRSGSVGRINMHSSTDTNNNNTINESGNNNTTTSAVSTAASHASSSSLDGRFFDPDLLLDRLGFIDLDPPLPHEIRCGPLAAPGSIDGKSNLNAGGLTPVNERLSEETLDDCHAFNDLVMIDKCMVGNIVMGSNSGMSSTMSMPSVAHSSLSGMRSDMSVGSLGSALSMGSFTKGGAHSREGSVAGGSFVGDGELSVLLGTLDEVGEEEEGSMG